MNLKEKSWYPIAFMFALTAFFSTILIGFAGLTRDRVKANESQALEWAVLSVLPGGPLMDPGDDTPALEDWPATERHELFKTLTPITAKDADGRERVVEYRLIRNGEVMGHALLFEGRGFWDVIRGVIGIMPDGRSIIRIASYEQHETPGLGAEITTPRFRDQFRDGKRLAESGPPLEFKPEHTARGPSEIDAITGATQTSTRLAQILDRRLAEWRDAMAKTGQGR